MGVDNTCFIIRVGVKQAECPTVLLLRAASLSLLSIAIKGYWSHWDGVMSMVCPSSPCSHLLSVWILYFFLTFCQAMCSIVSQARLQASVLAFPRRTSQNLQGIPVLNLTEHPPGKTKCYVNIQRMVPSFFCVQSLNTAL